jgi:hypothetical protein
MKLSPSIQTQSRCLSLSAFTLVEIMTAMFVFVTFLVAGMVAVQIFALRINHFTTDKLMAAGGSSKAMDQICNHIRSAQFLQVGNLSTNNYSFASIANGSSQQGNALEVFPTTNSTPYTIYYLNTGTHNLYYITNGQTATAGSPGKLLASWITNNPCFWSENFQGTINTTTNPFAADENCTIRMVWNFRQYASDNHNTNEFYIFQARATPRAPNF